MNFKKSLFSLSLLFTPLFNFGFSNNENVMDYYNHIHKLEDAHSNEHDENCTHSGWTPITSLSDITSDGSYYLNSDISLGNNSYTFNNNVSLCLNGHVLKSSISSGSCFTVSSGKTLSIYDCQTTKHYFEYDTNCGTSPTYRWKLDDSKTSSSLNLTGGVITNDYANGYGTTSQGIFLVAGTLNLYGGNIVGGWGKNGTGQSGGINMSTGTFNMSGGTITGCIAGVNGGGIFAISNTNTTNISGGTIQHNCSMTGGGGAYFSYQGGSKFNMTGGKITGNYAFGTTAHGGGGVCFQGVGTTTNKITGGEIVGNYASSTCTLGSYSGGGVTAWGGSTSLEIGGSIVIKDNYLTDNTLNNLYIGTDYSTTNVKLSLSSFTKDAYVGITMNQSTGTFTNSVSTKDYAKYFHPDNSSYGIGIDGTSSYTYKVATTKSITYIVDDTTYATDKYVEGTGLLEDLKEAPTKENLKFIGWYDAKTGGNKVTSIDTSARGDKTLYARYLGVPTGNALGGYYKKGDSKQQVVMFGFTYGDFANLSDTDTFGVYIYSSSGASSPSKTFTGTDIASLKSKEGRFYCTYDCASEGATYYAKAYVSSNGGISYSEMLSATGNYNKEYTI